MPAKLLGLALILAGLLFRRQFRVARERGYVGPSYRRVHRAGQRLKFNFALGSHVFGALVCFAAAYLCFTGLLHEF